MRFNHQPGTQPRTRKPGKKLVCTKHLLRQNYNYRIIRTTTLPNGMLQHNMTQQSLNSSYQQFIYRHEVAMFSLSTVWKAIFTRHTRIARRGRDGAREDRSAGWSPQAHSSHVVGCTSHPASRFHEIHRSGRKRLSFIYCPHHLWRRSGEACD